MFGTLGALTKYFWWTTTTKTYIYIFGKNCPPGKHVSLIEVISSILKKGLLNPWDLARLEGWSSWFENIQPKGDTISLHLSENCVNSFIFPAPDSDLTTLWHLIVTNQVFLFVYLSSHFVIQDTDYLTLFTITVDQAKQNKMKQQQQKNP